MSKQEDFAHDETYPAWFVNALQEYVSGLAPTWRLVRENATTVRIDPPEPLGIAVVDLQGSYRFRTTAVNRVHPGGAVGTYAVWAVATATAVDNVPVPYSDHTVYDFDLRITNGADPAGAGVEIFEKIGEIVWDGDSIEGLRQTYGAIGGAQLLDGAVAVGTGLSVSRQPSGAVLIDPVYAAYRAQRGTGLGTAQNEWTSVTNLEPDYDEGGGYIGPGALSEGYIAIEKDGIYHITAQVVWDSEPNGRRHARIIRNADESDILAEDSRPAAVGSNTAQTLSRDVKLVAGNSLKLQVLENANAAPSLLSSRGAPSLAVYLIKPLE